MSGAPRVLHLIDTAGPGGAETVFLNLAHGFSGREWESFAAVPRVDWLHSALEAKGLRPLVLKTAGAFDWRYLRAITRTIQLLRPAIGQTHLLTTAVYGSIAGRVTGVPTVSTLHGSVDAPLHGAFRSAKFRLLNRREGKVVAVSDSLRDWLLSTTPLRADVIRVIPNGQDLSGLGPDPHSRQRIRRELGLSEDDFVVGAVGNVRPSKDYATLLRAASELAGWFEGKLRIVVAGQEGGDLSRSLRDLRDSLGLEGTVEFLGFRSDARDLYAAFDLYVLSSSSEGFSLTVVEAMASGLPIVATRCGGPEEILRDGCTGLLVPVGDPRALAEAIHSLAHDRQRRAGLGADARADALARFGLQGMIDRYASLYREMLNGWGSRALAQASPSWPVV